ncbi:MAG TPA: glycosyltransferase family 2 protein [Longimicrobiales bacterium]
MDSAERSLPVYVLNWNGGDAVVACVASVLRSEGVAPAVYVIDNDSGDGSAERLAGMLGRERVIGTGGNRGYAAGMNAALAHLREAGGEHALLLTHDVRLAPDALARLVATARQDPKIALVGPVVVCRERPRRLIGAGGFLRPGRLAAGHHREVLEPAPYRVDWLDGCCLLARREAVDSVGGFDESYFLYFEDTDLGHRLVRAGWSVVLEPRAVAIHEKYGVPGTYYFHYMVRNRYRFWRKNFGIGPWRVGGALAVDTARLAGSWLRTLVWPRGDAREARAEAAVRLGRHLRGAATGTLAFLRGEVGRGVSDRSSGSTAWAVGGSGAGRGTT